MGWKMFPPHKVSLCLGRLSPYSRRVPRVLFLKLRVIFSTPTLFLYIKQYLL
jgi:hypothetical protein